MQQTPLDEHISKQSSSEAWQRILLWSRTVYALVLAGMLMAAMFIVGALVIDARMGLSYKDIFKRGSRMIKYGTGEWIANIGLFCCCVIFIALAIYALRKLRHINNLLQQPEKNTLEQAIHSQAYTWHFNARAIAIVSFLVLMVGPLSLYMGALQHKIHKKTEPVSPFFMDESEVMGTNTDSLPIDSLLNLIRQDTM